MPKGAKRSDRGAALRDAFQYLSKIAAGGQRGCQLLLAANFDYELGDFSVDKLHGCTIVGNNATIWSLPNYNYVVRILNSKQLTLRDLTIRGTTKQMDAPTNRENGRGLVAIGCSHLTIKNCEFSDHCGRRNNGDPEFTNNVFAHGIELHNGRRVLLEDVRVHRNGKYGIECRELTNLTVRRITGSNNGRQIINCVNDTGDPGTIWIEGVEGSGDRAHKNPLLSGCPGISIGSGTAWPTAKCVIRNVRLQWANVDQDRTRLGGAYAIVKLTDIGHVVIEDLDVQHERNQGSATIYSITVDQIDLLKLVKCKVDSNVTSFGHPKCQLWIVDSEVNRKRFSPVSVAGFNLESGTIRNSKFWFEDSAFDFRRSRSYRLLLVANQFRGSGAGSHVMRMPPTPERELIAARNQFFDCRLRRGE